MKNILYYRFCYWYPAFFASCNYLNIDDYFEDTFQEDSIYANKRNIERYFNGAAALLPVVDKNWEYGNTPGVTGSDEAVSCGDWNGMVVIQFSGTKLMNNEITSSSMGGWTWISIFGLNVIR